MTDSKPTDPPAKKDPLVLKREGPADELVIETGDEEAWEDEDEIVLSSNREGGSLTLLEEYSMRKTKTGLMSAFLAFACAAVSLTFAYLIYQTL